MTHANDPTLIEWNPYEIRRRLQQIRDQLTKLTADVSGDTSNVKLIVIADWLTTLIDELPKPPAQGVAPSSIESTAEIRGVK